MKAWPLLLCLLLVPHAAAHAEIARSEPPAGAALDAAPPQVVLELTQPVERATIVLEVTDQDGRRADTGDVRFTGDRDRPVLTKDLREGLEDGAYTIRLTATSLSDSHRITYTRGFAVGGFAPPTTAQEGGLDPVGLTGRVLAYMGLAAAAAALLFAFAVPDARNGMHRLGLFLQAGTAVHLAGALLILVAGQAASGQAWQPYLRGTVGGWLLLRTVAGAGALLLARLAVQRDRPVLWAGTALPLLVAAVAGSRFSHASQEGILSVLGILAHLLLGAVWVGGLALLALLVHDARSRGDLESVRRMALRFSTLAMMSVSVVLLTGVLGALVVLERALWFQASTYLHDGWGRALAAKVLLAAGMLLIAALHRVVFLDQGALRGLVRAVQRLVARVASTLRPLQGAGAARSFQALVAAEAVLGAGVLVAAAFLTSLSPPVDADHDEGLRLTGTGDTYLVTLFVDPEPHTGGNSTLRFVIQDRDGQAVTENTCGREHCITVQARHEAEEAAGETLMAAPDDGGWFVKVTWLRAGDHEVLLEVQTEEVFRDTVVFTLHAADSNA